MKLERFHPVSSYYPNDFKDVSGSDLTRMPAPMTLIDFIRTLMCLYDEELADFSAPSERSSYFGASVDAVIFTAFLTCYRDGYATNEVPRFDIFATVLTASVLQDACRKYCRWYQGSMDNLCAQLSKSPYVQSVVLCSLPEDFVLGAKYIVEQAAKARSWHHSIDLFGFNYEDYDQTVPYDFITEAYVLKLASGLKRFIDVGEEAAVWVG